MLSDFKDFIFRGNVLELAVAFVMGIAFNAVVLSFANDVVLELVAALFGLPDTAGIALVVNGQDVPVGLLLAAIVNFLIVGLAMFLIVRAAGRVSRRGGHNDDPAPDPEDVVLLREIRDALVAGR